jgi:uncharacterized protein (DUF362 family)
MTAIQRARVAIDDNLDVESSILRALDRLDGLEDIFGNKHVAIKPNETWASRRDLTACTQAESVEAVIKFVKTYRPARITVTGGAGAAETGDVFSLLGIDEVIRRHGVEFHDHNRKPFTRVMLDHGPQREVVVNPILFDYDTVISLAQHKVHHSAGVTLTLKNIAMSFPAADFYGHPREKQIHPHCIFDDLHGFIAGMCKRFPVDLAIIVGHPAMLERGPVGGRTFESGFVIAGRDAVAVDYVGARMLGVTSVPHIEQAAGLGCGISDESRIDIVGIPLKEATKLFRERGGLSP